MRHKLFVRLFYGIIGLFLLGACVTAPEPEPPPPSPPPPVLEIKTETLVPITRAIIERAEMTAENIKQRAFPKTPKIARIGLEKV